MNKILLTISLLFLTGCFLTDTICGSIKDGDHCYKFFAEIENNEKYCEEIRHVGPQSKCYMMLAKQRKIVDMCEKMPSGWGAYERNTCIQLVAKEAQDPTICDHMDDRINSPTDVTPEGASLEICRKVSQTDPGKGNCGWNGQPCCDRSYCKEEFVCNYQFMCVVSCGGFKESCCLNEPICKTGVCSNKYICENSCGKESEPCCMNNKCDPNMFCDVNTCVVLV